MVELRNSLERAIWCNMMATRTTQYIPCIQRKVEDPIVDVQAQRAHLQELRRHRSRIIEDCAMVCDEVVLLLRERLPEEFNDDGENWKYAND